MLTQEQFVANVWKKHEQYLQGRLNDNFYNKHQYKNINIIRNIKTVLTSLLGVMVLSGAVYAGYSGVNYVIEKYTQTNNILPKGEDLPASILNNKEIKNLNWIKEDNFKYLTIKDYKNYVEMKEIFDNLPEMNEDSFDNFFVLIIYNYDYLNNETKITNAYLKDGILNIELSKEKYDELSPYYVFSTKLEKELYSTNIKIINIDNVVKESNMRSLENAYNNYTIDEAIKDGCFVVDDYKIVSSDKEQFNKFLDDIDKGKNSFIRTYWINPFTKTQIFITDLKFINNELIVNQIAFHGSGKVDIFRGFDIELTKIEKQNGNTIYVLGGYQHKNADPMNESRAQLYQIELNKNTATD